MRVNFVLPPVGMSGGIRVIAIYAQWLADQGHHVTLVGPPLPRPSRKRQLKLLLTGHAQPPRVLPSHLDGRGLDVRTLRSHRPVTDRDLPDADVVIATWWETAEWVARLAPSKGAKCYFIQHHEVFDWLPVERVRSTYRLPLHKIVIARWLASLMKNEYGDPHVDLVPNSVDHGQFFAAPRSKQAKPTVGFIYSPTSFKGSDIALRAIAKLRTLHPELEVVSFGVEPFAEDAPPKLRYWQQPPQEGLREIYASADVWLSTSTSEGFNLPAMEAMACRTPLVSTRTGWPEESLVDGINGWCVPINDADAVAEAAHRVLSLSPADWASMSEAAYATVRDSRWELSSRLFENALRKAMTDGRSANSSRPV
jgi:glycosyltransferase involved in cell wall biosynthesis